MSEPAGNARERLPETLRDHRSAAAAVARGLKARYRAEVRFKLYGMAAVALGMVFLAVLFVSIISKGWSAFRQAYVQLEVFYDPAVLDPDGTRSSQVLAQADYNALVKASLRKLFPQVEVRADLRQLYGLISTSASYELQHNVTDDRPLWARLSGSGYWPTTMSISITRAGSSAPRMRKPDR